MRGLLVGILSFVMLLAGCSRSVDSRLVRVSQLADCNATDSALAVLADVCRDSLNEHNRYYYDLMSIKARDKAYLDITTDTTITDIIVYFERRGSENELGEAYYYGGRVSREQGDAPQALDYYQKALDVLTSSEHMYRKGKIASQMGQIFLELYMFEQAKPKFQEAIAYQTECEDSVGLMYNYRNLGELNQRIELYDSVLPYYNKSLKIASNLVPFGRSELEISLGIIEFYIKQKNYEEAIKLYIKIKPYLEKYNFDYIWIVSTKVHLCAKDYDNAIAYSQKLLKEGSIYSKKFASNALRYIYKNKNNNKEYNIYTEFYGKSLDSIQQISSKEAIIHQNSFYNYTIKEKENILLKEEKTYFKYKILISSSISIVILLLLLWLYEKHRSLKRQLALQLSKMELIKGQRKVEDNFSISENSTIKTIKEQLCLKYNEIAINNPEDYHLSEIILTSNIYSKIIDLLNKEQGILSEQDWAELDNVINLAYPKFKTYLHIMHENISEQEYKICMLVKCKFGPKNIGILTFRDKTTVTSTRKRLYRKFFYEEGKANDFDRFIYSL